MKNNCVDSCKFINYDDKKTCSINPDRYKQFYNENGKKIPYVDIFPEMDCFERSDLSKTYDNLMNKLDMLDEVLNRRK